MTHTPAPWKVTRTRATEDTHHHEVLARDEVVVCECFPINDDGQTDSESAANARLIAAAPELLAALEAINQNGGVNWDYATIGNVARAAIAKAKGE